MGVTEFLIEYFRARTEVQRAIADLRKPLDAKFLSVALRPSLSEEAVQAGADEEILTVQGSNGEAQVTTTGCWTIPLRFRYTVSKTEHAFQIKRMEVECGMCHGAGKLTDGKKGCEHCGSNGWLPLGEKRLTNGLSR